MGSDLAFKLAEMLKDCEVRERAVRDAESVVRSQEAAVLASFELQKNRAEELREESARFQAYRDIATERQKTEEMARKNSIENEKIADERSRLARETQEALEDIRVQREGIEFSKSCLADREAKLKEQQDALRDEKIKHHELVVKEMAMIAARKLGAK